MQKFTRYLKKPEYYFRPQQIVKRLTEKKEDANTKVSLLWGQDNFEVNAKETIGKSIQSFGLYDLALSEALYRLTLRDHLCLDVGANIGFFSSLMGYRGAEVHSFEPHPQIFARLKRNTKEITGVTCFNSALSDEEGPMTLYVPEKFESNEGLSSLNPQDGSKEVIVDVKKMDDLYKGRIIDVMKIDVEGHEMSVFKGAEELLSQKRIKNILFEEFNGSKAETISYLKSYDYSVYRLHKGFFNLQLLDPAKANNIPLWEPPNYIASVGPLDWKKYYFWQILKL